MLAKHHRDFVTKYWPTPGTPGFKIMNMYERIRATEQRQKEETSEVKQESNVTTTKLEQEPHAAGGNSASSPQASSKEKLSNGISSASTQDTIKAEHVNGASA